MLSGEKPTEFVDRTVKVTDMLKMKDELSLKLIEYFDKNFDVNFEELKRKYE